MAKSKQHASVARDTYSEFAPSARRSTKSLTRIFSTSLFIAGATASVGFASTSNAAIVSSGANAHLIALTPIAQIPTNVRRLGDLPKKTSITLDVALQPRNAEELSLYASAINDKSSASYHRYIKPTTFAAEFGASRRSTTQVTAWLRSSGLSVGAVSGNGLVLTVHASAQKIGATFHTSFDAYRLKGGALGWAAKTTPLVPQSEKASLASVIGLNNLVASTAPIERAATAKSTKNSRLNISKSALSTTAVPAACAAAHQSASGNSGWTDAQIAQAYGLTGLFDRGDVGQGQTIALFELEPFMDADVIGFDDCYFGESHINQVTRVPVDGFDLAGTGTGEAVLDVEDLSALAPAAKIDVYEAPNTTAGDLEEYNAIVSQDQANIISSSWGECEEALQLSAPGAQQVENTIFEEAAVQGQTVVAAAGDDGSDDCANTPFGSSKPANPDPSVDDPGSQPFVISVGGTSLRNLDGASSSEVVWDDGASGGASGGGFSNTWMSPTWQSDSGVPGVPTAGKRAVPDISASADEQKGITVYSRLFGDSTNDDVQGAPSGSWSTLGGTSSAAPEWAAILADIAASGGSCSALPVTAGGADLGFIAPELYAVASANYAQSFHDVTLGTNDLFRRKIGYIAGAGFDEASGLGSPIVANANGTGGLSASLCAAAAGSLSDLVRPVISSLSPTFGPATGGSTITIAGSGFPTTSSIRVAFEGVGAQVLSATPTSVTVVTPAAVLGEKTALFAGAGPSDVTVTAVSSTGEQTSTPVTFDYVNESPSSLVVPTITGVAPSGGLASTTTVVTLFGSGFASANPPTVTVGGVAASVNQVIDDYEMTVTLPPRSTATVCTTGSGFVVSATCQVQVVASNANGSSALAPILPPYKGPVTFTPSGIIAAKAGTEVAPASTEFDYSPMPRITSIRPRAADPRGTQPVVIHGRGFTVSNVDWVNFGPATSSASEQVKIIAITPTSITIDPPSTSPSTSANKRRLRGGVSVQTSAGLSNVHAFYYAGLPVVQHLSTFAAPTTSTTEVVVSGTNFANVTKVALQEVLAPGIEDAVFVNQVTKVSADQFTFLLPKHSAGPVAVIPCMASGCATENLATETVEYFNPAAPMAQISMNSGPSKGGEKLIVFGENVGHALTVSFGPHQATVHPARQFASGDDDVATITEPAGTLGKTVPVVVNSKSAPSRQSAGEFSYVSSVGAKTPEVGVSGLNDRIRR